MPRWRHLNLARRFNAGEAVGKTDVASATPEINHLT